jgi:hypothetical protein
MARNQDGGQLVGLAGLAASFNRFPPFNLLNLPAS